VGKRKIINLTTLVPSISKSLLLSTKLITHYEPKTDSIYYYFAQDKKVVNLDKINQHSN
jgi:hypothetical protein